MILNGLRCDWCKQDHFFDGQYTFNFYRDLQGVLPAAWVMLLHRPSVVREPYIFCGEDCLVRWATQDHKGEDAWTS